MFTFRSKIKISLLYMLYGWYIICPVPENRAVCLSVCLSVSLSLRRRASFDQSSCYARTISWDGGPFWDGGPWDGGPWDGASVSRFG